MYSKAKNVNKQNQKAFQFKPVSNQNTQSTIILEDEDDPCAPKEDKTVLSKIVKTPGLDPRFQQQNQSLRCYVMYTDFFNCINLLEGHEACTWFQDVYKSICPNQWLERWDSYRNENRMPWHKGGTFGKTPYGK